MTFTALLVSLRRARGICYSPYDDYQDGCCRRDRERVGVAGTYYCVLDHNHEPHIFDWNYASILEVDASYIATEQNLNWSTSTWYVDEPPYEISNYIKAERRIKDWVRE